MYNFDTYTPTENQTHEFGPTPAEFEFDASDRQVEAAWAEWLDEQDRARAIHESVMAEMYPHYEHVALYHEETGRYYDMEHTHCTYVQGADMAGTHF